MHLAEALLESNLNCIFLLYTWAIVGKGLAQGPNSSDLVDLGYKLTTFQHIFL